jgi:WD40 repeat protein
MATWSPDSSRIASFGDDKMMHVWDADTGATLMTHQEHSNTLDTLVWSPDGTRIGSIDDTTVQIWQAVTGELLGTYRGHSDEINVLAWSPDGNRIASASREVHIWQAV